MGNGKDPIQDRMDKLEGEINRRFIESLNDFGSIITTLSNRVSRVEDRLDKIEGRLDKIEGRLDKIEQKLDFFIQGTQWFMGKSLVLETLSLVVARSSSPDQIKFISETWNRITAFNELDAPPAVKESALQNYKDIKGFLEDAMP